MKSLRDQLVEKGLVLPEDTPEARSARAWKQRQEAELREQFERMNHLAELPQFEDPPPLRTAPSASSGPTAPSITCRLCGRDTPEPMMVKVDECLLCTDEVEVKVRGQMEWVHKSVPVLHIEGRALTSPEEYARMRRR